ncbi:hypothetical protein Rsub_12729 [Raphidocelis subcapitata]|uniref:Aminopeptidase n=1 Tax=Raphidocelis subcapitata TaxID=307507 RepID=A0A2V0PJM0_9CHLO|nr:hypothetical protein Rsub_12729 [Raphidocelis subcapitata]|eukprot:GBG00002.1 hypothetical protein Rsub_12729 [Raphidocelis subcapitata]
MPPEKHIAVPKEELLRALRARLPDGERPAFDELAKLMEGVASFDFLDLKERMRTNFLPFASGAKNQIYLQRTSKGLPTTTALDKKEVEFVSDVFDVLRASHYHLLTDAEWQIALAESFQLTLPMEVEWKYMDSRLLRHFWRTTPKRRELRNHLPNEMADRILVFHRGIGTARLKGLLIGEKLDLLCEYTVLKLVDALAAYVPKKWGGKKPDPPGAAGATPSASRATSPQASTDGGGGSGGGAAAAGPKRRLVASATLARQFSTITGRVTGGNYVASDHKFAKVVERVTLKHLCPSVPALLASFPKVLELQEPTFQEVVVVYRRAYPPRKPPSPGSDAPNRGKEERMQGILNRRNVYIKVFGETPMADVELIFPSKKVHIKPFQLVNLLATIVTALVTGVLMLARAGNDVSTGVLWTAASLVATRCFQVYSQAQTQKAQLQQDMATRLYDKMNDSQEGVVTAIMEEMGEQQFKQMVLAYGLLLATRGEGPTEISALDEACEEFLEDAFDCRIDFQVDDALPRLTQWGLVNTDGMDMLTAAPLSEAIETLAAAWALAYKALGRSRSDAIPTVDLLSGRASTFTAGLEAYRLAKNKSAAAAAAAEERKGGVFGRAKSRLAASFGGSGRDDDGTGAAAAAAVSAAGREMSFSGASVAGDEKEKGVKRTASFFKKMGKAARELLD